MTKSAIIYHNPRCSKSRKTLELLQENQFEPQVVQYLKEPLSKAKINELLSMLNIEAHQLLRTKEDAYSECGLSPATPATTILEAMVEHPILIQRPIVVIDGKAAIGRPPETIRDLF